MIENDHFICEPNQQIGLLGAAERGVPTPTDQPESFERLGLFYPIARNDKRSLRVTRLSSDLPANTFLHNTEPNLKYTCLYLRLSSVSGQAFMGR